MRVDVDVIYKVEDLLQQEILHHAVVMIDTLRCSSTIITALAEGVEEVFSVTSVEEAHSRSAPASLLVGENEGEKLTGFHCGNSPTELLQLGPLPRRMVIKTSNGSRAIAKGARGALLYIGSFLNVRRIADALLQQSHPITLLCAGVKNQLALEDLTCAGAIISAMSLEAGKGQLALSERARVGLATYLHYEGRLEELLYETRTGQRLCRLGYEEDLFFCSQKDRYDLLPRYEEGRIIK